VVFIIVIFAGALVKLDFAWGLSDIFNGLMAVPNLIALLLLSGQVAHITRNYVGRVERGEDISPLRSADEVGFVPGRPGRTHMCPARRRKYVSGHRPQKRRNRARGD